jgi:hypothetical protein
MSKRPTPDDFHIAAGWLEEYEADKGDAARDACWRVATYLRQEADRRERTATIAAVAREKGVSVALVRQAIVRATARRAGVA